MVDPFLAALDQASRTVVARVRGDLPAAATSGAPGAAISHTFCCDANRALCGLDVSGTGPSGDGDQECVVCADLSISELACALCADGGQQNVAS